MTSNHVTDAMDRLRAHADSIGLDGELNCDVNILRDEIERLRKLLSANDTTVSYKCTECGAFHLRVVEAAADRAGVETAEATEPAGYLHEVLEPDREDCLRMYSASPNNPWSHWVESHKAKCNYKCTPLYTRPAEKASGSEPGVNWPGEYCPTDEELERSAQKTESPHSKSQQKRFAAQGALETTEAQRIAAAVVERETRTGLHFSGYSTEVSTLIELTAATKSS